LINIDANSKSKDTHKVVSSGQKTAFKRVKVDENQEETKKNVRKFSREFSNASFGGTRQKSSGKLVNKKLDKILNIDPAGEESDNDSLDINIGQKIKRNAGGRVPNMSFADEEQQRSMSSLSFLQDVRNLSKTSSFGKKTYDISMNNKLPSAFRNPNMDHTFINMNQKNMSQGVNDNFNLAL
jgi:hypothetical protein